MPNYHIRVYPWENLRILSSQLSLEIGDEVIVSGEHCNELGIVEKNDLENEKEAEEKILRKATKRDIEVHNGYESQKEESLEKAKSLVKKFGLNIKLVDARVSLDGKQLMFVFISEERVDFRELVKELSREFKKNIRMQQIGSRDEARNFGDCGICGRTLCCVKFKGSIPSISTEMARVQQISHRGSERISGLCGRLMCCLAYEAEQYQQMLEGMPELYSVVETKEGKGTVIEINALTQEIKVKLENGKYLSLKKSEIN
jgi:cell fate regulator YaaT (PSP1 superfamily)